MFIWSLYGEKVKDREAWRAAVDRVAKNWHDWVTERQQEWREFSKHRNGLNNKGKHIFRNQKFKMCVLCLCIWTYSFIKNKGQKSRRKNHIWQVGRLPVTPFMCKQIKWLVKKIPRCKWILMQNIGPNIPHTQKICMTNINIKNFNILNIKNTNKNK